MIRVIAELKCRRHPRYMGLREPKICDGCYRLWHVVQYIRSYSRHYKLKWSDKVWPRISR